mmetsp:Transcript_39091/g.72845  ORF Transcript_39091/g.72845 Transcript_39091/m.72845 type:complete len:222 (+) Transcript_39091:58-723(+)
MCLGVQELPSPSVPLHAGKCQGSSRRSRLSDAGLEEILLAAAVTSAEAPNRALKRRVRQRLHKKLGSLLTCEEFGRAMDRFKELEDEKAESPAPAAPVLAPVHAMSAVPHCPPPIFALPVFVPFVARPSLRQAPQMFPPSHKAKKEILLVDFVPEEKSFTLDAGDTSETTADDEMDLESIADLQIEWTRALTEGSSQLPVERTFIQFNTRPHVQHRRSKSL